MELLTSLEQQEPSSGDVEMKSDIFSKGRKLDNQTLSKKFRVELDSKNSEIQRLQKRNQDYLKIILQS